MPILTLPALSEGLVSLPPQPVIKANAQIINRVKIFFIGIARQNPLTLVMGRKPRYSLPFRMFLLNCNQLFEKLRLGGCWLVFVAYVKSQAHLSPQLVFCVTKNVSAHCTPKKRSRMLCLPDRGCVSRSRRIRAF